MRPRQRLCQAPARLTTNYRTIGDPRQPPIRKICQKISAHALHQDFPDRLRKPLPHRKLIAVVRIDESKPADLFAFPGVLGVQVEEWQSVVSRAVARSQRLGDPPELTKKGPKPSKLRVFRTQKLEISGCRRNVAEPVAIESAEDRRNRFVLNALELEVDSRLGWLSGTADTLYPSGSRVALAFSPPVRLRASGVSF
ncbi:MAG TPA: hypothetical protein VL475_08440 [Planctomycetaceae bacterium]|nr:hypothetical protein [Planctomycetaceae bacterium]